MAFREVQLSTKISFGAIGGPGFNTDVVTVRSGHEKRNANWSDMRHSYEVSQALKTEEDFKAIRAFFMSVGGKRDGFRFKDWADYKVAITEGVAVGLGSYMVQLQKKYVSSDVTTLRDITKPIGSKFVLKYNGVTKTLTTDYTIDTATGIVTAVDHSMSDASLVTWSGEFDVPVRFDVDELRGSIVNRKPNGELLMAWDSIPIIEIRV